jgi:hypothetical protein
MRLVRVLTVSREIPSSSAIARRQANGKEAKHRLLPPGQHVDDDRPRTGSIDHES